MRKTLVILLGILLSVAPAGEVLNPKIGDYFWNVYQTYPTGVCYQYSGGTLTNPTWQACPAGSLPNPLAAAIQDKGGQVFNVKAYGAKGYGTTDDTAAIQAAINAAAAVNGTVYIPSSLPY